VVENTGTVIEAQADWLTVSAHGELKASRLIDLARSLEPGERAKGNRRRGWKLMGYEGAHCGGVEYGTRGTDHACMRLIGDLADQRLTQALSVADLCTRLDLAVTWRADPPDPLIGQNAYALAEMWHRAHPRSALPSRTSDADGGYTCYLGRRESENYLRVYNKGAEALAKGNAEEQERYRSCWRYELEVKGTVALPLAEAVNNVGDRGVYVQEYVWTWARKHGLEPAFPVDGGAALIPGFRRRSDSDAKLRHLARNVRPTVDWFRQEGKLDAARKALGLE